MLVQAFSLVACIDASEMSLLRLYWCNYSAWRLWVSQGESDWACPKTCYLQLCVTGESGCVCRNFISTFRLLCHHRQKSQCGRGQAHLGPPTAARRSTSNMWVASDIVDHPTKSLFAHQNTETSGKQGGCRIWMGIMMMMRASSTFTLLI